MPSPRISAVQDAVLLDLELGLAQHALLLQLSELPELLKLGVHVDVRSRSRCGRGCVGGLLVGLLLLVRLVLVGLLLLRRPAAGLAAGDRIAVAGVSFLREGMKVRDLAGALGGTQP